MTAPATPKMPPVPKGEKRAYSLQHDDGKPLVVNAWHTTADGHSHVDRWTPDKGWVDYPPDLDEVDGTGLGSSPATEDEAARWVAEGVGVPAADLPYDARVCQASSV